MEQEREFIRQELLRGSKKHYENDFRSPSMNSDFRYPSPSEGATIDTTNSILSEIADTDARLGINQITPFIPSVYPNIEPQPFSTLGGVDYK